MAVSLKYEDVAPEEVPGAISQFESLEGLDAASYDRRQEVSDAFAAQPSIAFEPQSRPAPEPTPTLMAPPRPPSTTAVPRRPAPQQYAPQKPREPQRLEKQHEGKGYDVIGGFRELARGLFSMRIPKAVAANIASALQGYEGASVVEEDYGDYLVNLAERDSEKAIEEASKRYSAKNWVPGITMEHIVNLPESIAASLTSAGAGILTGLGVAAATGPAAPVTGWAAGTAAAGTAAYQMTGYEVMKEYLTIKNEESKQKFGRGISLDEEKALKKDFAKTAHTIGLWEAIPEAAGQALGLGIIFNKLVKVAGKPAATRIIAKLAAFYGEEEVTEMTTYIGTKNERISAGLDDDTPAEWTDPGTYVEAFKETMPQTFLLSTIMGGAASGSHAIHKNRNARKDATIIKDAVAEKGYEVMPTDDLKQMVENVQKTAKLRPSDRQLQSAVKEMEDHLAARPGPDPVKSLIPEAVTPEPEAVTPEPGAAPQFTVSDVAEEEVPEAIRTQLAAVQPAPEATPVDTLRSQVTEALGDETQADAVVSLVEARARAAGETTDAYLQKRGIEIQKGKAADVKDTQLKQREEVRAFESKLQNVAAEKFQGMKAQSVVNFLSKQGVKKSELEATGLQAWLDTKRPTDKVTQQELNDFVKANTVQLSDEILGAPSMAAELNEKYMAVLDQLVTNDEASNINVLSQRDESELSDLQKEAVRLFREIEARPSNESRYSSTAQYSEYTEPGAEPGTYRELFITAPGAQDKTAQEYYGYTDAEWQGLRPGYRDQLTVEYQQNLPGAWVDGHAPYSNIQNPIVRARFDTRTDAQGRKILFIEELQGPSKDNQKKMPAYLRDNIYQLGVKRILAYAKANGYDGVAWTTGEMQAERYDLRKQVSKINYEQIYSADYGWRYKLSIFDKGRGLISYKYYQKDDLESAIGKEAAQKIIDQDQDEGSLTGLDLKVGGEGLKQLYDVDMANMFKSYGKEKVGTTELGAALKGFPTFTKDRKFSTPFVPVTKKTPGTYQLFQGEKGAVEFTEDNKTIISAFESADVSTMAHELGHVFRRDLDETDLKTVADWAGQEDPAAQWSVESEEKFARGFESYLATGKAPTSKLQSVFERFKQWLSEIYRTLKGSSIDVSITPEIQDVFDRLISPAEAVGMEVQDVAPEEVPEAIRAQLKAPVTEPVIEAPKPVEQPEKGIAKTEAQKTKQMATELESLIEDLKEPPAAAPVEKRVPVEATPEAAATLKEMEQRLKPTKTIPQQIVREEDYTANRETKRSVRGAVQRNLKSFVSSVTGGLDKALGAISTRLGNISPKIKHKMRELDFNTATKFTQDANEIAPLLRQAHKRMSNADFADWDYARKNSDAPKIDQITKKYGLEKEYAALRSLLDRMRKEAIDVGLDVGYIKDYSPRIINDTKGFLNKIGKGDNWPAISRHLAERARELGITTAEMPDDMKADIVSSFILGRPTGLAGISATKERKLTTILPEFNEFYMDSDAALMSYIYSTRKAIEARKFFGRVPEKVKKLKQRLRRAETRKRDLESKGLVEGAKQVADDIVDYKAQIAKFNNQRDFSENIGAYIVELMAEGKIDPSKEGELREILMARFHERGAHGFWKGYKNLAYIDVMGSPISALTQIADLVWSAYEGGLAPTIKHAFKSAIGKSKVSREDVGITHIAQEFADPGTLGKAVSFVFKAVGLEKIDAIGKEALLNTAFEKFQKQAKTDPATLKTKISDVFEGETDAVIEDLKKGDITDNVRLLVYNRLLDFQPVALSEMPEKYLKGGNGRLFYMLKTFTIKQMDVYRNEVYKQIASPDRKVKLQGLKNMARLSMYFVLANAGADELKDFILGRKTSFSDRVIENFLRLGGISKYVTWTARREGVGTAAAKQLLPPFKFIDSLSKDILSAGDKKGVRTIGSIPFIGKLYEWRFGRLAEGRKKKPVAGRRRPARRKAVRSRP